MNNLLKWKTIYYHEELDTDGRPIETEWIEEAPYKHGNLIKNCHKSYETRIPFLTHSITFIPNKET